MLFSCVSMVLFVPFIFSLLSDMSNSLNRVELIGNLTADPEIKETPNGVKVASFSIATNKKWKDDS